MNGKWVTELNIPRLEIADRNMSQNKSRSPTTYALLVWMIFNAIFYVAELTIFNDTEDLNNSIMLAYGYFQ